MANRTLRPTKLHTLLTGIDEWTPALRDEVVNYLYDRWSYIQMFKLAYITRQECLADELLLNKREKLYELTELLSPREVLAAWEEMRVR
jgi:hypothetical protein